MNQSKMRFSREKHSIWQRGFARFSRVDKKEKPKALCNRFA